MPVFETFPYTNFHELNLDWLLATTKKLENTVDAQNKVIADAVKYMKDNISSTAAALIQEMIDQGEISLALGENYDAATKELILSIIVN